MRAGGRRGNSAKSLLIRTAIVICLCLWGRGAAASPVIAAYQEIYRMNFEVTSHEGLPAGWYVTGDGYPVAQVRPNHWVYGRSEPLGILAPTEVAVGAVVPMNMPQLARVTVFWGSSEVFGSEKFRAIANARFDNMGVLNDPLVYTPVVWKSNEPELQIWLGDKWYRIAPRSGQSTYRAFMAQHPFIVRTLEEKNAAWTRYDTEELGDLAREWGFLWHGHIRFDCLPRYDYHDTGSDSGGETRTVNIGGGGTSSPSSSGEGSGGGPHWGNDVVGHW